MVEPQREWDELARGYRHDHIAVMGKQAGQNLASVMIVGSNPCHRSFFRLCFPLVVARSDKACGWTGTYRESTQVT